MKKLIFQKFAKDTTIFFSLMCFTIGLIVWTLQAVNYFDFVTQDGHGLKTYFSYILFNFPKIIHRIIPFIFFISLFYMIINYDFRNELPIFWINGITKIEFAHKIISLSIILTILQIFIGGVFSPHYQFKGRELLKNSNIDFFTSLIKPGKFINAVGGLTIFIEKKNKDETFSNIFIDDTSKGKTRTIYAKRGLIIDDNEKKIFKLFNGKVINNEKTKINVFKFDQIDFNLAEYSSNTILVPKIQETSSQKLLICSYKLFKYKDYEINNSRCKKSIHNDVNQELLKRFYKPLYIPIISILCCFVFLVSKNNLNYNRNRKIIFLFTFFILVLSEATLRYSTTSNITTILYLIFPLLIFSFIYLFFKKKTKNV